MDMYIFARPLFDSSIAWENRTSAFAGSLSPTSCPKLQCGTSYERFFFKTALEPVPPKAVAGVLDFWTRYCSGRWARL